jgi:hypothetical protein
MPQRSTAAMLLLTGLVFPFVVVWFALRGLTRWAMRVPGRLGAGLRRVLVAMVALLGRIADVFRATLAWIAAWIRALLDRAAATLAKAAASFSSTVRTALVRFVELLRQILRLAWVPCRAALRMLGEAARAVAGSLARSWARLGLIVRASVGVARRAIAPVRAAAHRTVVELVKRGLFLARAWVAVLLLGWSAVVGFAQRATHQLWVALVLVVRPVADATDAALRLLVVVVSALASVRLAVGHVVEGIASVMRRGWFRMGLVVRAVLQSLGSIGRYATRVASGTSRRLAIRIGTVAWAALLVVRLGWSAAVRLARGVARRLRVALLLLARLVANAADAMFRLSDRTLESLVQSRLWLHATWLAIRRGQGWTLDLLGSFLWAASAPLTEASRQILRVVSIGCLAGARLLGRIVRTVASVLARGWVRLVLVMRAVFMSLASIGRLVTRLARTLARSLAVRTVVLVRAAVGAGLLEWKAMARLAYEAGRRLEVALALCTRLVTNAADVLLRLLAMATRSLTPVRLTLGRAARLVLTTIRSAGASARRALTTAVALAVTPFLVAWLGARLAGRSLGRMLARAATAARAVMRTVSEALRRATARIHVAARRAIAAIRAALHSAAGSLRIASVALRTAARSAAGSLRMAARRAAAAGRAAALSATASIQAAVARARSIGHRDR